METKVFQGEGFTIENMIIKGAEIPNYFSSKTIGESILECLDKGSEKVAQIDATTGNKRTFKEIKERSIRLALWIRKEGIKPGDIVTVCSPNYPDVQIIMIATFFIGAIYNAFPHTLDLEIAKDCFKQIDPRVIFVYKNNIDVLQEASTLGSQTCKMISLDTESNIQTFDEILKQQSFEEIENFQVTISIDPESVCVIMPTSGTTGTPKFTCHTCEKTMLRLSTEYSETNNTTLIQLYPEWTFHFRPTLLHLFLKNTVIFLTDAEPNEFFRVIEKYKVNTLILDPYRILTYCNAEEAYDYNLISVTNIKYGGRRLYQNTIERLRQIFPNAHLCSTFGSTETGAISRRTEKCRNPESQGTILPNVQLKIVDVESRQTLGPNKTGEIYVNSPFAMVGYYEKTMKTSHIPYDEAWFQTGDEGYYDENGEIIIIGRLKDIIKYRGTYIRPNHIEQILVSHPDIIQVAVVGITHDSYVEQPVACIKKVPGSNINDEDVLKLMSELEYKDTFKNWIFFFDELPRTSNGKINRRLLKQQFTMGKLTNM